jgi:hypothetical protein
MRHTKTPLIALLVAVLSLWTVEPAAAAAITKRYDRSDNMFSFHYDSGNGQITSALSGRRLTRNRDRVDFFTYVTEREGAAQGRRLRGRISLRLYGRRAVRYDGRFRLVVRDETGAVAFRDSRDVDFVLRPRRGRRTRVLRWAFDLPTGDYTAVGRFRADYVS